MAQNLDSELTHEENEAVDRLLHPFIITDERLESFLRAFSDDLQKGLKKETNSEADMKCFPTYVSRLPSGKEKGRYLVS